MPGFEIARYPVTVADFKVYADAVRLPEEMLWRISWKEQLLHPKRPVVWLKQHEAVAYCDWAGVRLPTEEEWEFAAAGTERRKYPWGDAEPTPSLANFSDSRLDEPTDVGSYPLGATPSGIHDMAGNVFEWTATRYDEERWVLKGGCFITYAVTLACDFQYWAYEDDRDDTFGFRAVRSR
jgi:formylglycine-generating enzyme required for sulfatase activity